jgi:hypothetical protein
MTMEEGRELKDEYTQDGTVNLKGKPVLRSKTGGWKACSFIVGKISQSFFIFLRISLHGTMRGSKILFSYKFGKCESSSVEFFFSLTIV